ncbi:MAG: hypothetical protein H7X80_00865, partial [bacterium]|nr:hypothetical protein [Candidatus Kapabacteria bacterium]
MIRLLRALIAITLLQLLQPAAMTSQISYPDFTSTAGLRLVGAARRNPPALRLTDLGRSLRGAVWFDQKVRVVGGFVTTFQFQIYQTGGRNDNTYANGGDGIAFVV